MFIGRKSELDELERRWQGERFEFETNMLIATKEKDIKIIEVPVDTIYLEGNKSSHFNPLIDSFRIYKHY